MKPVFTDAVPDNLSFSFIIIQPKNGGSTGFFGRIEQSENGSVITGKFRKPVYTYVIAVLWALVTLFLSLVLFAIEEKGGALCMLGVFLLGVFIMFWDNKKPVLKAYLDSFRNQT